MTSRSIEQLLAEIPAPLQQMVLGGQFPTGDPEAMRRLARWWRTWAGEYAELARRVAGQSEQLAGVFGGVTGQTGAAVVALATRLADELGTAAEYCIEKAEELEHNATALEKAQWEMAVFLVLVLYQLLRAGGWAGVGGLVVVTQARQRFLVMLERLISTVGTESMAAAGARAGLLTSQMLGLGAVQAGIDLGVQLAQGHRREHVDVASVVVSGVSGIAAGTAGVFAGRGTAHTIGAAARLPLGRAVVYGAGGMAGVMGEAGAVGLLTGEFEFNGLQLLGGGAMGMIAVGTAAQSVATGRNSADLPTPLKLGGMDDGSSSGLIGQLARMAEQESLGQLWGSSAVRYVGFNGFVGLGGDGGAIGGVPRLGNRAGGDGPNIIGGTAIPAFDGGLPGGGPLPERPPAVYGTSSGGAAGRSEPVGMATRSTLFGSSVVGRDGDMSMSAAPVVPMQGMRNVASMSDEGGGITSAVGADVLDPTTSGLPERRPQLLLTVEAAPSQTSEVPDMPVRQPHPPTEHPPNTVTEHSGGAPLAQPVPDRVADPPLDRPPGQRTGNARPPAHTTGTPADDRPPTRGMLEATIGSGEEVVKPAAGRFVAPEDRSAPNADHSAVLADPTLRKPELDPFAPAHLIPRPGEIEDPTKHADLPLPPAPVDDAPHVALDPSWSTPLQAADGVSPPAGDDDPGEPEHEPTDHVPSDPVARDGDIANTAAAQTSPDELNANPDAAGASQRDPVEIGDRGLAGLLHSLFVRTDEFRTDVHRSAAHLGIDTSTPGLDDIERLREAAEHAETTLAVMLGFRSSEDLASDLLIPLDDFQGHLRSLDDTGWALLGEAARTGTQLTGFAAWLAGAISTNRLLSTGGGAGESARRNAAIEGLRSAQNVALAVLFDCRPWDIASVAKSSDEPDPLSELKRIRTVVAAGRAGNTPAAPSGTVPRRGTAGGG
ncbi:hypothetical protein, partial [Nocardia brasiliensis]|uniref:WXG100-like domain-containing protein n=1 Tax=Nocardia brasiliensis TaxID=37326 RepID=UPI003CC7FBB6